MKIFASLLLTSAVVALSANSARAADVIEAPVYSEPAPPAVIEQAGGWYIRGDIDYHMVDVEGITYSTAGGTDEFIAADLDDSWSLGGGIGYNVSKHFRVDLTADYWAKSDFRGATDGGCGVSVTCISTDTSAMSAWVLLANAYADLGTYGGFTPYIGAGIGVAHVAWDDLSNTSCDAANPASCDATVVHGGGKGWRAAGALMAGASYCVTDKVELDGGYRYTRVGGGEMFGFAVGGGPGYDDGFDVHEVRGGLRYNFGGGSHRCAGPVPQVVEYQPEPAVYK
jgi:opacity protein-like surface antigen